MTARQDAAQRHVREVVALHESGPEAWCPECRVHWPCDTARLLALVDTLGEGS